jgi:tetratricopeptide (TPR) repeat protein
MSPYAAGLREFEQGHLVKAVEFFSQAIASGDEVANAFSKRGVCQLRLGSAETAERDFRAALLADARCLSAMVNLGNLMLERGDLDDAELCYKQALRIDETYAPAHHNLGVLLRRRGKIGASVRELRLATKYEAGASRRRLGWWKGR